MGHIKCQYCDSTDKWEWDYDLKVWACTECGGQMSWAESYRPRCPVCGMNKFYRKSEKQWYCGDCEF